MSDPHERLSRFDPGPAMHPLPPADVRRRGDRLRRRNQALAGVGAALAVVLIATPIAVFGSRDGRDADPAPAPPPAPPDSSESVAPPTDTLDIPTDFPLAAGWPERAEPGGDNGLTGPSRTVQRTVIEACGAALPEPGTGDALRARWTNPEDYRSRDLLTFPDTDAAEAFVTSVTNFYAGCPTEAGSDGYTTLREVRETRLGDDSYAVVQHAQFQGAPAIGLQVLQIVRVDRAVLIDAAATEGSITGSRAQIGTQADRAADVVAAMCALTATSC